MKETTPDIVLTHEERDADARTMFGFWVYLMTDCVLFASLFAVYAVLHGNIFGGPSSAIFNLPFALGETLVLLTSSFLCGLGILAAHRRNVSLVLWCFGATFVLGALFIGLELSEFVRLVHAGDDWQRSAFLSSYFTLLGTHGLHVTAGLLWMATLFIRVMQTGLSRFNLRNLMLLSLFWHFLDVIWIFIFTVVYLVGAL